MIQLLLAFLLVAWIAYAIGRWHSDAERDRMRRRVFDVPVIGRDVAVPRALAHPAIVRRKPWGAWRS